MKWYPAAWINDTRSLSPEAKGCWIDILCLMWNAPKRGVWEGTYQEFARVTGLPWQNVPAILIELSRASRVTERDNLVTLENRRMIKQETDYKSHAKRQKEYRERRLSDKKVTNKTLDVRRQTLDNTLTPIRASRSLEGEALPYKHPDKTSDPIGAVVMAFKTLKGVAPENRDWDKRFWARWVKDAKEIVNAIGGVDNAISFLKYHSEKLSRANYSWNLRTIADRAIEWKARQKDGADPSQRVFNPHVETGAGEESGGLRAETSAGAILDAVRGGKSLAPGHQESHHARTGSEHGT